MKPTLEANWKQKSIENLEKSIWKTTEFESGLIKKCHELRKLPIEKLTVENVRLLIGQEICLKYLVPFAIEILSNDLFAEGDFYEGDLLSNVLKIRNEFWEDNKDYWNEINNLIKNRKEEISEKNIDIESFYRIKT